MKKLWTQEWLDYKGKYCRLKQAKLYVKSRTPVPIYVASFGPKVAEIAGSMQTATSQRWCLRSRKSPQVSV